MSVSSSHHFSITGLNHLALVVSDMSVARHWFSELLGLAILQDRGDLVFYQLGTDILAIKSPERAVNKPEHGGESQELLRGSTPSGWQHLDHYGFYAATPEEVDAFAAFLREHKLAILKGPYDRSDGRSVYFRDPCGLVGEYLYLANSEP